MSTEAADLARTLRNGFYREADTPLNVCARRAGRWCVEPSGARDRAIGIARELRALYGSNPSDPWVCQCWAQVESYAVNRMIPLCRAPEEAAS